MTHCIYFEFDLNNIIKKEYFKKQQKYLYKCIINFVLFFLKMYNNFDIIYYYN